MKGNNTLPQFATNNVLKLLMSHRPNSFPYLLQHWQQLARPQFGGFLENRPGIIPFALQAQRQRIANIRGGGGMAGPFMEEDDYQVFSDLDDDDLYTLSGTRGSLVRVK